MKFCKKCKTEKPRIQFYKYKKSSDGLFSYCRRCCGIKSENRVYAKPFFSNGYVFLPIKNHPLSNSSGYVLEHRYVYYEKFFGEILSCELCGVDWDWRPYYDHIDHIDKNKSNNKIENLRPLCNSCNTNRDGKSWVQRAMYITFEGETRTPNSWSKDDRVSVTAACIRNRIRKGMTVYESLFSKKLTNTTRFWKEPA